MDLIDAAIASKQNKLTAGDNITIEDDVISASGGWKLFTGDISELYDCTYTGSYYIATIKKPFLIEYIRTGTGNATYVDTSATSIVMPITFYNPIGTPIVGVCMCLKKTYVNAGVCAAYVSLRLSSDNSPFEVLIPRLSATSDGVEVSLATRLTTIEPIVHSNPQLCYRLYTLS